MSNENRSSLVEKFFWRFVLLFLLLYIIPYDLAFGFTDKFEEWRLWHKPIFWIGEQFLGWEFDYENPLVGWDSKFEVSRYIFIFLFGTLLSIIWLLIDYYHIKKSYEGKLKALTQTFLRYRIAIVMLHYGIAKLFLHQFGTMDIDTLESTIGGYGPMSFMWKYMSFSEEVQLFSGIMETLGAILLFFRKTTFLGAIILLVTLINVVLFDIGYGVSVKLYAIQLLILTLILLSNQITAFYRFFVLGDTSKAKKYQPLFTYAKLKKQIIAIKVLLLLGLGLLYANDRKQTGRDYFGTKYGWFTGLHEVNLFLVNGDTINNNTSMRKWKRIIFNDIQYFNDTFKIEFANENENPERFKFSVDSVLGIVTYRNVEDEKDPWHTLKYKELDEGNFEFEGVFKEDTIMVKTKIKRLEDYNLIKYKNKWLVD